MMSDINGITVCAFTGHRAVKREHSGRLQNLLARAIDYAYSRGARTFIAGGALGFDTLAARQVVLFKISHPDVRLELVIPCRDQAERWTDAQRDFYDFLLSRADSIEIMSDRYTEGCMKKRNARLVERADMLIAYASGKSYSGSMQTVRMAKEKGIEVYNLYPSLEKE